MKNWENRCNETHAEIKVAVVVQKARILVAVESLVVEVEVLGNVKPQNGFRSDKSSSV